MDVESKEGIYLKTGELTSLEGIADSGNSSLQPLKRSALAEIAKCSSCIGDASMQMESNNSIDPWPSRSPS